jgi:hypothetical protein
MIGNSFLLPCVVTIYVTTQGRSRCEAGRMPRDPVKMQGSLGKDASVCFVLGDVVTIFVTTSRGNGV